MLSKITQKIFFIINIYMKKDIALLYWIRLPEHTDPLTDGYIGVTKNFDVRMKSHITQVQNNKHKNLHLVNAIKKYGWENIIKEVILTDKENTCYLREAELRPSIDIGWNIAPGGHKGPGRKKGQKLTTEAVEKMKDTIKLRNSRIENGLLTEEDRVFLDKKNERRLLTLQRQEEKKKERIQNKAIQKQKKIDEKEKIKKQKILARTSGILITRQPSRPLCENCKVTLAKSNGISKHGFNKWHKYCVECSKAAYNPKFGYLLHKKNKCEKCSFIPEDKCQLDIIYKDNNKKNKEKSNLKTLCANCNRVYQKKLKEKRKSILDITVDTDYTL